MNNNEDRFFNLYNETMQQLNSNNHKLTDIEIIIFKHTLDTIKNMSHKCERINCLFPLFRKLEQYDKPYSLRDDIPISKEIRDRISKMRVINYDEIRTFPHIPSDDEVKQELERRKRIHLDMIEGKYLTY